MDISVKTTSAPAQRSACLVVGVFVIQGQVRLEEKHLRRRYGDVYVAYCRSVPRWLPLRFSRTGSSP